MPCYRIRNVDNPSSPRPISVKTGIAAPLTKVNGQSSALSIDDEALEADNPAWTAQSRHQYIAARGSAVPSKVVDPVAVRNAIDASDRTANVTYALRKFVLAAGAVWLSLAGGAFADVILNVSYAGGASSHFDRDYYVKKHLPLVQKSWGAYGLKACSAFFPSDDRIGVVAVAVCKFKDRQSLDNAFNSSATAAVLEDVKKFTDIPPNRTIATPF
ncbi:EthD family reductase [Rhizobium laguerreae]|nr:EthD family reductase [Rhizobium laguerreae]